MSRLFQNTEQSSLLQLPEDKAYLVLKSYRFSHGCELYRSNLSDHFLQEGISTIIQSLTEEQLQRLHNKLAIDYNSASRKSITSPLLGVAVAVGFVFLFEAVNTVSQSLGERGGAAILLAVELLFLIAGLRSHFEAKGIKEIGRVVLSLIPLSSEERGQSVFYVEGDEPANQQQVAP